MRPFFRATVVASFVGVLCPTAQPMSADVGDVVAVITPSPGSVGNFCSIGVAFDGTDLYFDRCGDPLIYRISTADGSTLDSFDPMIPELPNAMAFDAKRNGLWIGAQACNADGMPVYFHDFDTSTTSLAFTVPFGLVNPATGNSFLLFCFLDGIAYNENDPTSDADDEIYFSDDVIRELGIFRPNGTLVSGFDTTTIDASLSTTSGVAVGGTNLYLGNNGGGDVFRVTLPAFAFVDQFVSDDERQEDMECDPVTFAPIEVMWVRTTPQGGAFPDVITAYEIEPGTCGLGGGKEPICLVIDFETDDEGEPLVHGQHLDDGDPEFDGGSLFPVTITSRVNQSNASTAAILNSDVGPALQDPDLLVGSGNVLILQTDANTTECPPGSGVYCTHDDDEDGGTLTFDFVLGVMADSVALIDVDGTDGPWSVVLTDVAGSNRTYTVPPDWTGDFVEDGGAPAGRRTLDLTVLAPQPGFASVATAVEGPGFVPNEVVQIEVNLGGSGAVDDLSWCVPETPPDFASAHAELRNGMGINPLSLSWITMPVVGRTLGMTLDCTAQGSGIAILEIRRRAITGTPTAFGEVLIGGQLLRQTSLVHAGSANLFTWDVPNDVALCGIDVHAQGLCTSSGAGQANPAQRRGVSRLSNALDLVLGF